MTPTPTPTPTHPSASPAPYTFPPAYPHGALVEVFPDVFSVTGSMRFPGPIGVYCSRAMTIVRHGGALTLINTVRLGDEALAKLDALGRVEHVIRLAGFHGSDDPFYKERYGATVWAVRGHKYAKGFDMDPPAAKVYFHADREMDADTVLPVPGKLYPFRSCPPGEALLLLDREGGILVAGDALQNWAAPDPYFNLLGRMAFRAMGFFRANNVGPGWLKQTRPDPAELTGILDLTFDHVLPCHGAPVVGGAKLAYRPAVLEAAKWAAGAASRSHPR